MTVSLSFPGEPKAIQSVRFSSFKGYVQKYQPKANTDWKGYIKMMAMSQLPQDWKLLDEPLGVTLEFVFSPPKATKKKDILAMMAGATFFKITKPDLTDNLCKGLIDALTGLVWRDDSLICKVASIKRYGEKPYIHLEVDTLPQILENRCQL